MENKYEKLCKAKEEELIEKYFGKVIEEAASGQAETIGGYTKDLPLKIEAEFREFLESLWEDYTAEMSLEKTPLVLEEQELRTLITEDDREGIEAAYKNAVHKTLWERIAGTNHKDVTYYKGLLLEYTKELLMVMRIDFLEEITGKHINCKSYGND